MAACACVQMTSGGSVSLLAGNGTGAYGGDGGAATDAALREPRGVFATSDGRVFIADAGNNRIRMVSESVRVCMCVRMWLCVCMCLCVFERVWLRMFVGS